MAKSPESPRQDASVSSQYDAWARIYDAFWRRYLNQTLPVLQRAATVTPEERVLDLACGTGELERRLVEADQGRQITGIDIAPSMVERAQRKLQGHSHVHVQQADAHDLPFEGASFDVVLCANTFHYFSHPATVLEEAGRVLRPDGRLVVLDWCRDFWTCRVMDAVLHRLDPAHHACYSLERMGELLDESVLTPRYMFRYRFDLVWGMMVVEGHPQRAARR